MVLLESGKLLHPSKGQTMAKGGAISLNGVTMFPGWVPLMFGKIIHRIFTRQFNHQRISGNLGHDGGSSNGGAFRFALDEGALRGIHGNGKFSVNQQKIRGRKCGGEVLHRPSHGQKRGLKDIDPVNGRGGDQANAYVGAYLRKDFGETTTPGMGKFFGVNEEREVALLRQHHAGSHHRPGQWPSAGLIQPGDTGKTLTVQGVLVMKGIVQIEIISGEKEINPLRLVIQV